VIARLYDPERECVYGEFGIEHHFVRVLSATEIDKILAETACKKIVPRRRSNENKGAVGWRKKQQILATSLIKGISVTVINDTYEDCMKMAEIDKLTASRGNGTNVCPGGCECRRCGMAIALTSRDETIGHLRLCKKRFHAKNRRTFDGPEKTTFFTGWDRQRRLRDYGHNRIIEQRLLWDKSPPCSIGGTCQHCEVPIPAPTAVGKSWGNNLRNRYYRLHSPRVRTMVPRGDTVSV
jgi:trk system potassium uptake protein TrkA